MSNIDGVLNRCGVEHDGAPDVVGVIAFMAVLALIVACPLPTLPDG